MDKKTEHPLIIQLKQNMSLSLQNLLDSDTLEKYLASNKNIIEETLKNIKEYEAWREELYKQDELSEKEVRELKTVYPHGYSGVDVEGRPVWVHLVGQIKLAEMFKMIEDGRLVGYFGERMEELRRQIFPHVQKKQLFVIIDLKGQIMKMSSKRTYTLLQNLLTTLQRYYPSTLHKLYFVNTPIVFQTVWSTIKKSISEETLSKIVFLGSDFEEQIGKYVTRGNLPECLGGDIEEEEWVGEGHGPWVKGKKKIQSGSESQEEVEFDMSKLKAALSNVLPVGHQVPHGDAQTPLNTESDEK